MIEGGNVTVFVEDMDRAVAFYTEVLGLSLKSRYEDHWAEIDAGKGFVIGLHPRSERWPAPGTAGSMQIGLGVSDIAAAVKRLGTRGVDLLHPIVEDGPVKLAFFQDPDGSVLYLCEEKDWQ